MTTSIGHRCKGGNVRSRVVLIARQACAQRPPAIGGGDSLFSTSNDTSLPKGYVVYLPFFLSHYYVNNIVGSRPVATWGQRTARLARHTGDRKFRWPWRRGPPLTIPNREVKPVCADGTAIPSGRVGSRLPRKVPHSFVRDFFYVTTCQSLIESSGYILFLVYLSKPTTMIKNILLSLFSLTALVVFPQEKKIQALVGGTLIDGFGSMPIKNSVIIIEGEKIITVGTIENTPIPANAEIVSTEGMTVLPGLWDMHVHTMINGHADYDYWDKVYPPLLKDVIMPASAHQLLMAGVTSARDLGAPLEASISVRDAINNGEIPGATLYVSGPFIQHEPYPGTEAFRWGVTGAEDGRKKIKKLANAGVDLIKLIDQDQMTMEELKAVVDEAHKNNLKVVAHGHRPEEIRRALLVGADCIEHTGLSSAPEYPKDIMDMIKERTAQMNKGPLFWCPTVEGLYNYEYLRDNPEKLDSDSWHLGLPDSVVADIRNSFAHPDRLPYFQLTPSRRPTLQTKVKQLLDAGVVLLIGTDSGIPMKFHSQSTWNELDVWVNEFGIDPMYAIRAATYWPALWMGVADEVGTITPGKYADIIAVNGDVLRYISLLQDVDMVIKHGKRYK